MLTPDLTLGEREEKKKVGGTRIPLEHKNKENLQVHARAMGYDARTHGGTTLLKRCKKTSTAQTRTQRKKDVQLLSPPSI